MRKIKEIKVVMNRPTSEQVEAICATMAKAKLGQIKSKLDEIECSAGQKEEILGYVVAEMKTKK